MVFLSIKIGYFWFENKLEWPFRSTNYKRYFPPRSYKPRQKCRKQCTCTSLAFMMAANIQPPVNNWTSELLDDLVLQGTRIYDSIPNKTRAYLLVTDLPATVCFHGYTFTLATHEPYGSTIGTSQTDRPFYSVHDALTVSQNLLSLHMKWFQRLFFFEILFFLQGPWRNIHLFTHRKFCMCYLYNRRVFHIIKVYINL